MTRSLPIGELIFQREDCLLVAENRESETAVNLDNELIQSSVSFWHETSDIVAGPRLFFLISLCAITFFIGAVPNPQVRL